MMASDYRSPAATAFSPWGKMPLAAKTSPTDAHRDLGWSERASVLSFHAVSYGSNRSERASEACAENLSIRGVK